MQHEVKLETLGAKLADLKCSAVEQQADVWQWATLCKRLRALDLVAASGAALALTAGWSPNALFAMTLAMLLVSTALVEQACQRACTNLADTRARIHRTVGKILKQKAQPLNSRGDAAL
jgi:hypothetical protein